MWGQGYSFVILCYKVRIIPTRVGTRYAMLKDLQSQTDHPHACGDKFIMRSRFVVSLGSSPRVWGQERCLKIKRLGIRIIPTRVGTSRPLQTVFRAEQDHPHACGDKIK